MIYQYICEKCEAIKEVDRSIKEGPPKIVECGCGENMHRVWGSSTILIPDHFKAVGEGVDVSEIGRRINHSRPSGKRKVFF